MGQSASWMFFLKDTSPCESHCRAMGQNMGSERLTTVSRIRSLWIQGLIALLKSCACRAPETKQSQRWAGQSVQ